MTIAGVSNVRLLHLLQRLGKNIFAWSVEDLDTVMLIGDQLYRRICFKEYFGRHVYLGHKDFFGVDSLDFAEISSLLTISRVKFTGISWHGCFPLSASRLIRVINGAAEDFETGIVFLTSRLRTVHARC